jgi:hypothetical protein
MVACITRVQYPLDFLLNQTSIPYRLIKVRHGATSVTWEMKTVFHDDLIFVLPSKNTVTGILGMFAEEHSVVFVSTSAGLTKVLDIKCYLSPSSTSSRSKLFPDRYSTRSANTRLEPRVPLHSKYPASLPDCNWTCRVQTHFSNKLHGIISLLVTFGNE